MKFSFVGKQNVVSDSLKQKTIDKMQRLEKFLTEDTQINVTYKVTNLTNKIEVHFTAYKKPLRAEAKSTDMYTAIDLVTEMIEKQLRRLKSRIQDKHKRAGKDLNIPEIEESYEDEIYTSPLTITRKSFVVEPMEVEDAIMEMELSGHQFYLFRNTITNEVNVVFKSKGENKYGLLDPS
ncbi:MAG: ribosome-associated translation inhibitor RaiA [Defluviitaleaceae bacterium]|nr:ribosome-associated translation inhibitor RaiA [Defluviitaleaceae bacterium]